MSDQSSEFGEEFINNAQSIPTSGKRELPVLTTAELISETRGNYDSSHSPKEINKNPELPRFNHATINVPSHTAFYNKFKSMMMSNCNSNGRMKHTHVIALLTSVLLFMLLCLLLSSTEARNENQELEEVVQKIVFPNPDKIIPPLYPSSASLVMERILQSKFQRPSWKMLPEYVRLRHGLKFVLGKGDHDTINENFDIVDLNEKTYKVAGNSKICMADTELQESKNNIFPDVTHVEISEILNCKNYVEIILNSWTFPKIQHIKLQRMVVDKEEFSGLISFIDRHNETISKVEIDACYVCHQPECDAGLINYPDHDFHIAITRRRDSAEWVLR